MKRNNEPTADHAGREPYINQEKIRMIIEEAIKRTDSPELCEQRLRKVLYPHESPDGLLSMLEAVWRAAGCRAVQETPTRFILLWQRNHGPGKDVF